MTTPTQRLSAAYADSTPERRTRRLESLARLYTPDAGRDALLELKATDRAAYYRLPKASGRTSPITHRRRRRIPNYRRKRDDH